MPAAPHRPAATPRRARATARREQAQRRLRRRRLVVTAVTVVTVLAAGSYVLDWWTNASGGQGLVPPPASPPAEPLPAPSPAPSEPPEPTEAPPVLSLPGDFPTAGPGTFALAATEGEVLGEAGTLRRFQVAVEDGIDEDPNELAAFVVDTLDHEQGWTAGGSYRFQQVPEGAGHEFTLYLVTSETAGSMCAAGGLRVIAPGLPEGGVSCRLDRQVIINLSRWRLSVANYVDAEVPLETYRQMLLNHEIGHELGYGHYGCPGDGQPAPVMQQQSLFLDGCTANPWPYLDGVHHTGPPAG